MEDVDNSVVDSPQDEGDEVKKSPVDAAPPHVSEQPVPTEQSIDEITKTETAPDIMESDQEESFDKKSIKSGTPPPTDDPIVPTEEPIERVTPKPSDKLNRELRSIMAAAKEANLDTNIAHKRHSLPEPADSDPNSIGSTPTVSPKRNMRSQNPEFAAKQQKFMSKVTGIPMDGDVSFEKDSSPSLKRKLESPSPDTKTPKVIKLAPSCNLKVGQDLFCWQCHKDEVHIQCMACPRSFHLRCLKHAMPICENWTCSECMMIMQAENPDTRSYARRKLNDVEFMQVLKFALNRMLGVTGSEPFCLPVNTDEHIDYFKYVVTPMDLSLLRKNIDNGLYRSTEAFQADTKWILHNSMVYNSAQSKLTSIAKSIVKTCRIEMAEIETCPQCYINANTQKNTWFIEVCSKPHILVWAKLKGFPFWPAKAVNFNDNGMVDVRFFGAHDKAWVPVKDVYLYSVKDPNSILKQQTQKHNIAESIKEVDRHIKKLVERFGAFVPAEFRTTFEPENLQAQLKLLLPNYRPGKLDDGVFRKRTIPTKTTPRKPRRAIKDYFNSVDKVKPDSSVNGDNRRSVSVDHSIAGEECGYGTEDDEIPTTRGRELMDTTVEEEDQKPEKSDSEGNVLMERTRARSSGRKPPGGRKRFKASPSPTTPKLRRDSEVSNKSSKSSRFSEKVNKVELTQATEIQIGSSNQSVNEEIAPQSSPIVDKPKPVPSPPNQLLKVVVNRHPINTKAKAKTVVTVDDTDVSDKSVPSSASSDKSGSVDDTGTSDYEPERKSDRTPIVKKPTIRNKDEPLKKINRIEPKKVPEVPKKIPIVPQPETADPVIDIKEEVLDTDEENDLDTPPEGTIPPLYLPPDISLTQIPQTDKTTHQAKPTDNLSQTIENVVKGAGKNQEEKEQSGNYRKTELKVISVAEINQKKHLENQTNKQKARKSFPNKPTSVLVPAKKRPDLARFDGNKDKMVYIPQQTNKVVIQQPFNKSGNFVFPQNMFNELSTANTIVSSAPLVATSSTPISSSGQTFTIMSRNAQSGSTINLMSEEERNNGSNNTLETLPVLQLRPGGAISKSRDDNEVQNDTQSVDTLTQILNRSSSVMTDFFNSMLVEAIKDLSSMGCLEAKVKEQQLELEKLRFKLQEDTATFKLEIETLKQAHQLDKQRALQKIKQTMDSERVRAVEEAKSKQWCAMCMKESQYRCCWSTSYCSYSCQRSHWSQHQSQCQQNTEQRNSNNSTRPYNDQQPPTTTRVNNTNDNQTGDQRSTNSPLTNRMNRNDNSVTVNPVKNTYAAYGKQNNVNKNAPKSKSLLMPKTGDKLNLITSKAGPSGPSVPTLTFVQNSAGGIELLNHGPIALGGKLIPSQFPSKIKGYIVSSSAVTTLSPSTAPVLAIPTKSITLTSNNRISTTSLPTPPLVTSSSIQKNDDYSGL